MTIAEILRDSNYKITQFDLVQIQEFEKRIVTRPDKKGVSIPYVTCAVRKRKLN